MKILLIALVRPPFLLKSVFVCFCNNCKCINNLIHPSHTHLEYNILILREQSQSHRSRALFHSEFYYQRSDTECRPDIFHQLQSQGRTSVVQIQMAQVGHQEEEASLKGSDILR